jgi:hypothetical protein
MTIKVFIDLVILESNNFSTSQRRHLQTEIQSELVNLLTVNGIPRGLKFGGTIQNLSTQLNCILANTHPSKLGKDIASSIYMELRKLST